MLGNGEFGEAGNLLHSLAVIYWGMAGVIALFIVALAPFIANYWLQSKHLSQETIVHAVMLMGLVIALPLAHRFVPRRPDGCATLNYIERREYRYGNARKLWRGGGASLRVANDPGLLFLAG